MSFADSLTQFRFLSELYAADCPGASLFAEYPSSNSTETDYRNTDRFIIHDPFPPPTYAQLKVLGPHHLMCGWGQVLPVSSDIAPPPALLEHWQRLFGNEAVPGWQAVDSSADYITLFPHESLPAQQQLMTPDLYYPLHGKCAIGEIDCPQPAILPDVSPPCVIKLNHGYAGTGNFFIRNAADEQAAKQALANTWPDAVAVVTRLVDNIAGDYGAQFYVDRLGGVTWLGVTEQLFNQHMRWAGGTFSASTQDYLYQMCSPIADAVAGFLYDRGYFGVVGVDILHNENDDVFLVDLNPRLTGITPFLVLSRLFSQVGLSEGVYAPGLTVSGGIEQLITQADNAQDVKAVIYSAYENPTGSTTCYLSVNGASLFECRQWLEGLARGSCVL